MKLKDAAKLLKINYSTCKTIMRLFRIENRINRKKKGGFIKRSNSNVKNNDNSKQAKKLIKLNEENLVTLSINTDYTLINKQSTKITEDKSLLYESNNCNSNNNISTLFKDISFYYNYKCLLLNDIQNNYMMISHFNLLRKMWINRSLSISMENFQIY